jgi:hypothetical protein
MNIDQAVSILGINRARYEVQNMALALTFGSYLNTKEEQLRLEASAFVLKRWKAYQQACNKERNLLWR